MLSPVKFQKSMKIRAQILEVRLVVYDRFPYNEANKSRIEKKKGLDSFFARHDICVHSHAFCLE